MTAEIPEAKPKGGSTVDSRYIIKETVDVCVIN